MKQDYDSIVIGSGMGGMTFAGLSARLYGRRVLLLERHGVLGGMTHHFSRPGGYQWDVGLHYVGRVGVPCRERDTMLALTNGEVEWAKMKDPFDEIVFPGLTFRVSSGEGAYRDELVRAFPREERAIDGYFRDVRSARRHAASVASRGIAPDWLRRGFAAALPGASRLARAKTGDYLREHFEDPALRAVVGARWGDYGVPPGQSAFFVHATIMHHYFDGAWYPAGGSSGIAAAVVRAVEEAGGEARTNAEVAEILVEGGEAVGVRLTSGEEHRARVIVSAAGVRTTLADLLPDELARPYLEDISGFDPGYASASVHIGLTRDPRALGVHGQNIWLHDELDHDSMFERRNELLEGPPPAAFLSFPSIRDPLASAHTAEVMAPVDIGPFERVSEGGWKRRGQRYEELKSEVAERLLAAAERAVPGLAGSIVHAESSSPLTMRHFTNNPFGEIYGLPFTPERLDLEWLGPKAPVPGLYLAGADVMTPGVVGAMMGGAMSLAAVEGAQAFRRITRRARSLLSEGVDGIFSGSAAPSAGKTSGLLAVRVAGHEMTSQGVASITLEAADGVELPAFEGGAHVSVHTPGGWVRPYSLCSDPSDLSSYRLGVLAVPGGRASRELVGSVTEGQILRVARPRNLFEIPGHARSVLLMGAGIGVTPMMAMAHQLLKDGRPFELHHSARGEGHAPFRGELEALLGERYVLHLDDGPASQLLDPRDVLAFVPGRHLMVCGPEGYMDWIESECALRGWPEDHVHRESFASGPRAGDKPFVVELANSRLSVEVSATQTIAEALEEAGVPVHQQCGSGTCGTCLCRVLEGEIDHRDEFLTEEERERGDQVAVCVSRARSGSLVLDL